jgi:hypothetical protein
LLTSSRRFRNVLQERFGEGLFLLFISFLYSVSSLIASFY